MPWDSGSILVLVRIGYLEVADPVFTPVQVVDSPGHSLPVVAGLIGTHVLQKCPKC